MDEFKDILGNIKSFYQETGNDLDAQGGVHRCKVCGHEIPHNQGDGAKYLSKGWPEHCGKGTVWVTQKQLEDEIARLG